jgi:hypothetical protein
MFLFSPLWYSPACLFLATRIECARRHRSPGAKPASANWSSMSLSADHINVRFRAAIAVPLEPVRTAQPVLVRSRYRRGIFRHSPMSMPAHCISSQPEYLDKLSWESAIGAEPTSLRSSQSQLEDAAGVRIDRSERSDPMYSHQPRLWLSSHNSLRASPLGSNKGWLKPQRARIIEVRRKGAEHEHACQKHGASPDGPI